ncbi:MAG TPA: UDP-N-acetyl-D-mannosamine dehydrogenase, partial [Clostridiales bacterium]|nr:UDP-N-acetyl-D-mannosamine dehydrogenase [Clostridiales bacterium]
GVGGHCIAVDPWFLVSQFSDQTHMISTGRMINDSMPDFAVEQIMGILGDTDRKISVLGITYKPDVDDVRESPVLKIAEILNQKGYRVAIHDPLVARGRFSNADLEECLKDSDMLLLGVNHKAFLNLDLAFVYSLMRSKIIFDTRNFINKEKAEQAGFEYYLLGCGYQKTN